ncbi:putative cytochrome P450 monooxygenase [Aspergillus sclerotioniger CBS 115572]|uniref:Putative cytochrome P450 monooxygenase n=1 Tax=Aspergillus sclerotioniger CBS 115572 TaxID=1450535 RepID=A0A317WK72_9EURO|nr:putative cytochrome P450 monooxygenase [Aspergillus sclerotioniger CBS 115572]PWY86465.1 putative cytochrome P450 monooxygenase [Aspergillus sclerotioniger CBS 115572]
MALWLCYLAFAVVFYYYLTRPSNPLYVPTVKYSRLLPDFINRILYYVTAPSLIHRGYEKYKDRPFRILKPNGDLIVLPAKYLKEIHRIPPQKLNPVDTDFKTMLRDYAIATAVSDLPAQAVTKRLNVSLGQIIPEVIEELHYAISVEIPKCKEQWASINLYNTILRIVSRTISRVAVGEDICRSEEWTNAISSYTSNAIFTINMLQFFPWFLRPLISQFTPLNDLHQEQLWIQRELLVPMIQTRRFAEINQTMYIKPDDLMQWMMDLAKASFDRDPESMARGLLELTSVKMIHTTTLLVTHALYELVARPAYKEPLRHEARKMLKNGWSRVTPESLENQRLLDSFLRESQRWNPPSEVNVHYIAKRHFTLSDGLQIPRGSHICFAAGPMAKDPSIVSEGQMFNGFRWCKDPTKRLVSTDLANLHFGSGSEACPGRFFAVSIAKLIMSRLLCDYDMNFEERQARPANLWEGDRIMPNPRVWFLIQERKRD